jgi:hypothetical protein
VFGQQRQQGRQTGSVITNVTFGHQLAALVDQCDIVVVSAPSIPQNTFMECPFLVVFGHRTESGHAPHQWKDSSVRHPISRS